jgi:hypothetical protein
MNATPGILTVECDNVAMEGIYTAIRAAFQNTPNV